MGLISLSAHSFGYSSGWTCQWLSRNCCQRQTYRTPASYSSAVRPSRTDKQRAELSEGKGNRTPEEDL